MTKKKDREKEFEKNVGYDCWYISESVMVGLRYRVLDFFRYSWWWLTDRGKRNVWGKIGEVKIWECECKAHKKVREWEKKAKDYHDNLVI